MNLIERMRAEWNARAKQDVHFYVAFGGQQQDEAAFMASAEDTMPALRQEFHRLAATSRALEIGCGPGRLMTPMSQHFTEVHGVDISSEMIELARTRLAHIPGAHVHLTSGADLQPLADNDFDFVYSYTVFQHIPDRATVLSYLREARRVLKPGGVLRCQLRGAPPIPSEITRESDTWTGCYFTADDMAAFAREQNFPLLEISGLNTQYMWTTFRKIPANAVKRPADGVLVKAITAANTAGNHVPARGRDSAVSLWIDAFPEDGDLSQFPVWFDQLQQLGCYLSPISPTGGCQLNARLPKGTKPGPVAVRCGSASFDIVVDPAPPHQPRVLKITDGINLTAINRVETGGIKVIMEEIAEPETVRFKVEGREPLHLNHECKDPITDTYEFAFHLPHKTRIGKRTLEIEIAGRPLTQSEIDVLATRE
jgi:ubiquinone/menaquinone biosynthesis C-methylase UbiE